MRSMKIALAAAGLSVAWCGQAWADEASEKALAKKVEELQKQLDEVSKRIGDGSNRSNDELEQRIAELEKVTKKDSDGLFAYWKNGVRMESVDGAFKFRIFGRIQQDWQGWDAQDDVSEALGNTKFGEEFRRARLGVAGTMYKNVDYKAEYDFAGGSGAADFQDVYMELRDAFGGTFGTPISVRVGHFDEPYGLERNTSSNFTTFTERSLCEAFVPARNSGIMVSGQALENRLAWFGGFFRDTNNFGNDLNNTSHGEHNWTARVAGRPYISEDGTKFIHVGVAGSYRNPSNEVQQYQSRPEVHQGPQFVATGSLPGIEDVTLLGLEFGAVMGALHAEAEFSQPMLSGGAYMDDDVELHQDDFTFQAYSVQVGYFLTGESRGYNTTKASFDRVAVKKNYGKDGWGALEVAVRYSHLDLNDGDLDSQLDPATGTLSAGGELTDYTLGINWYLNSHTRVMLDFIRADREHLSEIDTVVLSFRIDF